jgi:PadR family transcriptional regulator, regulatory protein PadR
MEERELPRLSALDEDVLTLMNAVSGELYGLEILQGLNRGRPEELIFSSLYPALKRLLGKNCLSWRWGEETDGDSGGGRRKYYRITDTGRAALARVRKYRKKLATSTVGRGRREAGEG